MKRKPERKQWLRFRESRQESRAKYFINAIYKHIETC